MAWYWWTIIGVYVFGFCAVFTFNWCLGMITSGLCLLRAAVWPIYVTTGWPAGEPLPMD